MHEGVTKHTEERRSGLASAEPLDGAINPRGVPVVRRRSTVVALSNALDTDEERGAIAKVYIARKLQHLAGNYRSCLAALLGAQGRSVEDVERVKLDLEREYERWRVHMIQQSLVPYLSVLIDIVSEGKDFANAGRSLAVPVSDKTAKQMAIIACRHFVIANETPAPVRDRPAMIRATWSPYDKPTRVIDFIA
jgi:hypothetical protein